MLRWTEKLKKLITYNVYELWKLETDFDSEYICVIDYRTYEFVVSTEFQQVIVKYLSIWVRLGEAY